MFPAFAAIDGKAEDCNIRPVEVPAGVNNLAVTDLKITPNPARQGNTVTVSASVRNQWSRDIATKVQFRCNGTVLGEQDVTVPARGYAPLSFTLTACPPGKHSAGMVVNPHKDAPPDEVNITNGAWPGDNLAWDWLEVQEVIVGRGQVLSPSDPRFKNNTVNAKTAFRYISGARVAPGAVFSFNRTVGERTLSRGFVWALSGSGGRYYSDVGGGVCQAVTALHRAVVSAGLEVVERHRHPGRVPYAPQGDDAAVAWDAGWDYRFRNTLPLPVRIRAKADGQKLSVELVVCELPEGNYRAAFFDGQTVWFDGQGFRKATAVPYTENGKMYAAVRDLAAALNIDGSLPAKQTGLVSRNGVACVPVRDAAAAFDHVVSWNAALRCALIQNRHLHTNNEGESLPVARGAAACGVPALQAPPLEMGKRRHGKGTICRRSRPVVH
ncbi:MAG: VanW family protein [Bacillota bacterium]